MHIDGYWLLYACDGGWWVQQDQARVGARLVHAMDILAMQIKKDRRCDVRRPKRMNDGLQITRRDTPYARLRAAKRSCQALSLQNFTDTWQQAGVITGPFTILDLQLSGFTY
jgi:hypothetical protein